MSREKTLSVNLPELAPEDRIPADDLFHELEEIRPYFLTEFCRILQTLLGRYKNLHMPASERYGELARWTLAAAPTRRSIENWLSDVQTIVNRQPARWLERYLLANRRFV